MHSTFTEDLLHIDDVVVYLKNERTGSSTIRKCKFIGQIVNFTKNKVEIRRLSMPDIFAHLDEIKDLGIDTVYSDDVVHIIFSRHQEEDHIKMLGELNDIIDKKNKDIKQLIGKLFCTLEDESVDPWSAEDCISIANKYWYTKEDYKKYLNTLV